MSLNSRSLRYAILVSIALPVAAYANQNFNGYYVGAGAGVNVTTSSNRNTSSFGLTSLAPVTSLSSISPYNNSRSIIGELELGYGRVLQNHYYLGLSGFIDFSNRGATNYLTIVKTGPAGSAVFRDSKSTAVELKDISGGIVFEPGYTLASHTLLLGVVGWERAQQEVSVNHSVSLSSNSAGQTISSSTNNLNGLRLGIGFLQHVTPSVALGVRYTHTSFARGDALATPVVTTTSLGGITGPFSYTAGKPDFDTQSVMLDLRYYLNASSDDVLSSKVYRNGLSGYYVTGRLGALIPDSSGTRTTIDDTYTDRGSIVNQPILTSSSPGQKDSPVAAIGVGMGKLLKNNLYLGVEGSLDWAQRNIDNHLSQGFRPTTASAGGQAPDVISHDLNVKFNNLEPAVDVKLGMLMPNNFLPYVRLGMAYNKVDYDMTDQLTYFNSTSARQTVSLSDSGSVGSTVHLRLGAGFEYQYSDHDTFGLSYIYTHYGKLNIDKTQTTTDVGGNTVTLSNTSSTTLKNNVLTIAYTHYFGE